MRRYLSCFVVDVFSFAFNVWFCFIFFQNSNVFWSDSLQAELIWEGGGRNLGTPTVFNENNGGGNDGTATNKMSDSESNNSSPAPIKIEPNTSESPSKGKSECDKLKIKKEADCFSDQDMLMISSGATKSGVNEESQSGFTEPQSGFTESQSGFTEPQTGFTEPQSGNSEPPSHLAENPQLGIVYMEDVGMKYAPNMLQDISALAKSKYMALSDQSGENSSPNANKNAVLSDRAVAMQYGALMGRDSSGKDDKCKFWCDLCGKGYAAYTGVYYHKQTVHSVKSKVLECKICGGIFHRTFTYKRHMKNIHNQNVSLKRKAKTDY